MLISKQVALYLHALGVGIYDEESANSTIYIDALPAENNVIAVYNRAGNGRDSKLGYTASGVQIIYRGNVNPITSMESAKQIFNSLVDLASIHFVEGENYIVSCKSLQGQPERIGQSKEGQFEYTMNFIIEYQE
jgi:hypothetical protein